MDGHVFDEFSRAMARGIPRRKLLARLGFGGLGASLLGVASLDPARSAVPVAQAATCQLELVANIRLGASAGATLGGSVPGEVRGQLSFGFDDQGAISDGRLRLDNGQELPVVGQALGRAVHLRVANGDQPLVLVGTAEQDLAICQGAVDGMLTGPQLGDLGDWHATATALSQRSGSTGSGGGGTGAGTGQVFGGTATSQATAEATAEATSEATSTPTCPEDTIDCGGACVDPNTDPNNCGDCGLSCPAGRTCSGGECVCSEGTTECLGICCTADEVCVEGHCNPIAVVCPEDQADCGGVCVDPANDTSNCGGCGIVCPPHLTCFAGGCVCPEGTITCAGSCCPAGEDCLAGQCVPTGCAVACAPGLTPCTGANGCDCCDPGQLCNSGVCV